MIKKWRNIWHADPPKYVYIFQAHGYKIQWIQISSRRIKSRDFVPHSKRIPTRKPHLVDLKKNVSIISMLEWDKVFICVIFIRWHFAFPNSSIHEIQNRVAVLFFPMSLHMVDPSVGIHTNVATSQCQVT